MLFLLLDYIGGNILFTVLDNVNRAQDTYTIYISYLYLFLSLMGNSVYRTSGEKRAYMLPFYHK